MSNTLVIVLDRSAAELAAYLPYIASTTTYSGMYYEVAYDANGFGESYLFETIMGAFYWEREPDLNSWAINLVVDDAARLHDPAFEPP
jgi:hypothetical protein